MGLLGYASFLMAVAIMVSRFAMRAATVLTVQEIEDQIPSLFADGLTASEVELELIRRGADPDDAVAMVERTAKQWAGVAKPKAHDPMMDDFA